MGPHASRNEVKLRLRPNHICYVSTQKFICLASQQATIRLVDQHNRSSCIDGDQAVRNVIEDEPQKLSLFR
ncbi:hypothetical protein MAXJ12_35806 [Mesorhizobium alhagi CCNWXJ12-2]|uniref:Uncharacterized protein n=1 Tax=Mesorhizobium alhagi CCNWXJ12-2 TaxID=1107882 RepID=H0I3U4_9HYPH|nr:hypothetical protein MAXJ12_35806 [Mesorhizobium alhagi CCNWXJ12-2]